MANSRLKKKDVSKTNSYKIDDHAFHDEYGGEICFK